MKPTSRYFLTYGGKINSENESTGMSDSEEQNLPSADECDKRCKQFAEITGTDSALAMFYLQDRNWDLDRAINAFFEGATGSDHVDLTSDQSSEGSPPKKLKTENTSGGKSEEESEKDKRFRLLSWNIDGLDMPTAVKRAHTVCEIINKENPHVVYLQEVVESTQEVLEARCPTYQIIPGGDREYFTSIMIKVGSVMYREMNVTEYPGTHMMRNLLCVKCKYRGSPLTLMTSHLESTAEYGTERKAQLKMAFDKMVNEPEDRTVIFGGDLNLRDKELAAVGGIPSGIVDLWEETGSRPEAKYTWDMTRNDNLTFNGKYKPRCRFDRLYMKSAKPMKLKPVYFELVGLEKQRQYGRFPSDHWGLLTHYDVQD